MVGLTGLVRPLAGYASAVLITAGTLFPFGSSSFSGDAYFAAAGMGDDFFLRCLALASLVLVFLRKYEWLWLTALSTSLVCLLALVSLAIHTDAGRGQWAALWLGSAFVDFGNTYWAGLRVEWGTAIVLLGAAGLLGVAWPSLTRAKIYDVLIALPLLAFYFHSARQQFAHILYQADRVLTGTATMLGVLQMISVIASILFSLLLILLIFARTVPVGRSRHLIPRFIAIAGTFAGTAFLLLEPIALPLSLQILATVLTTVGMMLSFLVLLKLGRSFSIMPEARKLITTGPYALVRHPLYLVEEIAVLGMLIQFAGPLALGFAIGHVTLQYMRTVYEEEVLETTFPDYQAYRLRTRWRFIPGLV